MKLRMFTLMLLVLTLLVSLIGCDNVKGGSQAGDNSTTINPPITESKPIAQLFQEGADMGLPYLISIEKGGNAFTIIRQTEGDDLIYAIPLTSMAGGVSDSSRLQATTDINIPGLFYRENRGSSLGSVELYASNSQSSLCFTGKDAQTLRNGVEDFLASTFNVFDDKVMDSVGLYIPKTSAKQPFTYLDSGVQCVGATDMYNDCEVLSSLQMADTVNGYNLSIAWIENFPVAPAPQGKYTANETAPLLANLISLNAGYVKVEGGGTLTDGNGKVYDITMTNTGIAPLLQGSQYQISAIARDPNGKESQLFITETETGRLVVRFGDIMLTLTEQSIISLSELLSGIGVIPPQEDTSPLPEMPDASNMPMPEFETLDMAFDENGHFIFDIAISQVGRLCGALVPTENGIALELTDTSVVIESETFTVNGNFALLPVDSFAFNENYTAPVVLDMDAVTSLISVIEQMDAAGYTAFQMNGVANISVNILGMGNSGFDAITYRFLANGDHMSMIIDTGYPSIIKDYMTHLPSSLPEGATLSPLSPIKCHSELYNDGNTIYIATTITVTYIKDLLSTANAQETFYAKIEESQAGYNVLAIISHMLNIDFAGFVAPDAPVVPNDIMVTASLDAPRLPPAISVTKDAFGNLVFGISTDGVAELLNNAGLNAELPEGAQGITAKIVVKTQQNNITALVVTLHLQDSLTVNINGDTTFYETYDQPIIPQGLEENPLYEWLIQN